MQNSDPIHCVSMRFFDQKKIFHFGSLQIKNIFTVKIKKKKKNKIKSPTQIFLTPLSLPPLCFIISKNKKEYKKGKFKNHHKNCSGDEFSWWTQLWSTESFLRHLSLKSESLQDLWSILQFTEIKTESRGAGDLDVH